MNEVNYSDYFYYDESSRTFLRWKRDCRKYKQSSVAGSFCYDSETENPVNIRVRLNERLELVHRIICASCASKAATSCSSFNLAL